MRKGGKSIKRKMKRANVHKQARRQQPRTPTFKMMNPVEYQIKAEGIWRTVKEQWPYEAKKLLIGK